MAQYYFAPEFGARFVLIGPDGSRAAFNNPSDADNVGMLTDITGLDSPDVRDAGDILSGADGGYSGINYYGRRPITMPGQTMPTNTVQERNVMMAKFMRASNAMGADAALIWRPSWGSTNLVPNPNFSRSIQGWGVIATGAQFGWPGGGYGLDVSGTTSSGSPYLLAATAPNITGIVPGAKHYFGCLFRTTVAASTRIPQFRVDWYTSAAAYISSSYINGTANLNGIQTLAGSDTAPPTATNAQVVMQLTDSAGYGSSDFQIANVYLSPDTNSYIDGDTGTAWWFGTPGQSPSGNYVEMYAPVRRQQPTRFTGGWIKDFQALMVSQYAPLFSSLPAVIAAASSVTAENYGNYPAYPVIRLAGASATTVTITNTVTGAVFKTLSTFPGSGSYMDIDMLNHTMNDSAGASQTGYIDFVNSTWPALVPGLNTLTTSSGTIQLTYRHSWV